jgi:hypothetical protein
MQEEKEARDPKDQAVPAHTVRLPGFLLEEEAGLGDLIKKVTYALGVPHCKGCEHRAATLNRWIRLTR